MALSSAAFTAVMQNVRSPMTKNEFQLSQKLGNQSTEKQQQQPHQRQFTQLLPPQQQIRRQISQTKVPEAPKRQTEMFQRKAPPSADVRCLRRQQPVNLDKHSLNKTFTVNSSSSTDFRQRCSDGTLRSPTPIFRHSRNRSNSIDSERSDFGPDVVFGILTRRHRTKSRERHNWNFSLRMRKSNNGNSSCGGGGVSSSTMDNNDKSSTTKLPQLDGFCPGRTSCQFQHVSRSHFELIKYKRTLNS